MSAPVTRDPLVVTTQDGTSWVRRAVTQDGHGLCALEGAPRCCPGYVLASLKELREFGLRSMADALPVPVGSGPQVEVMSPKIAAELNDLRTRLAGMANPPREVFLALYEGAEPELFTTVEAARECCDDLAKTDSGERYWDWTVNEFGVHVQFWTHPDDDRPLSETSGSVTPIVVQGDEPLSELERLRALLNAQPVELSEAQIEALADAGNGAVGDFYHERQCACSEYPEGCATDPQYRRAFGFWDTGAFEIGMAAVVGLWESMRADLHAGELATLRARVAELEAQLAARDRTVDEDPITYAMTDRADGITRRIVPLQAFREDEAVTPQVERQGALPAGQPADAEGEHYAVVHHDSRDMPGTGGAE